MCIRDSATGFYNIEFHVDIYPEKEWESKLTKLELIDKMQDDLSIYPGIDFNFSCLLYTSPLINLTICDMLTQIINARILTPQGWLKDGSVLIRDNKILEVTNCDLAIIGAKLIDAKGMYIVPGGVETVSYTHLVVETVGKVKHLGISPSVMVEEILPGEGIRYTASIHAGEKLKDGEVTFRVAVADENGDVYKRQGLNSFWW